MSDDVNDPADHDGDESVEPEEQEAAGDEEDAPRAVVETALDRGADALVFGHLVLHYESRDVTLFLDGGSALRLLAMFARRRTSGSTTGSIRQRRRRYKGGWCSTCSSRWR